MLQRNQEVVAQIKYLVDQSAMVNCSRQLHGFLSKLFWDSSRVPLRQTNCEGRAKVCWEPTHLTFMICVTCGLDVRYVPNKS